MGYAITPRITTYAGFEIARQPVDVVSLVLGNAARMAGRQRAAVAGGTVWFYYDFCNNNQGEDLDLAWSR